MDIVRKQEEVDDLLNKCIESEESGESRYPGMTYEQGIRAAIDWLTGDTDDNPLED